MARETAATWFACCRVRHPFRSLPLPLLEPGSRRDPFVFPPPLPNPPVVAHRHERVVLLVLLVGCQSDKGRADHASAGRVWTRPAGQGPPFFFLSDIFCVLLAGRTRQTHARLRQHRPPCRDCQRMNCRLQAAGRLGETVNAAAALLDRKIRTPSGRLPRSSH